MHLKKWTVVVLGLVLVAYGLYSTFCLKDYYDFRAFMRGPEWKVILAGLLFCCRIFFAKY